MYIYIIYMCLYIYIYIYTHVEICYIGLFPFSAKTSPGQIKPLFTDEWNASLSPTGQLV